MDQWHGTLPLTARCLSLLLTRACKQVASDVLLRDGFCHVSGSPPPFKTVQSQISLNKKVKITIVKIQIIISTPQGRFL